MKIRIVVLQLFRKLQHYFFHSRAAGNSAGKVWQTCKARVQFFQSAGKYFQRFLIQCHRRKILLENCLLQNLVQLPRRLQQIQLRLLPLKRRIQQRHPLLVFIHPGLFNFLQAHFAFVKSCL